MTRLIGADQPFGVSRKLSYRMTADRYTGRVLYVTFRTAADLRQWVPQPLELEDPHEAFLKIYQLKRRPVSGEPYPPSFSQYREACVTVLARAPDDEVRHYNIFMWVTHDWAIYKARAALGWPKKIANIEMTATFPDGERYDRDVDVRSFDVDVDRYGYPIIRVRARLDSKAAQQAAKPFNGFYTIRHIPSPAKPLDDICELLIIEPQDGWFGPGMWGAASLEFGDAPDEELSLIQPVEVTSCVLRDTGWTLPGWPARRLMSLAPLDADLGEARPSYK